MTLSVIKYTKDDQFSLEALNASIENGLYAANKADDIINAYEYENWYIGGHSLGGAMAASYAADHLDMLRGVVLLSAYPTDSLKEGELSVRFMIPSESYSYIYQGTGAEAAAANPSPTPPFQVRKGMGVQQTTISQFKI